MKAISNDFKTIIYSIRRNKLYSGFYIIGTAFTFVFIILLLQYSKIVSTDTAPVVNSNRLFVQETFLKNDEVVGFVLPQDLSIFESLISGIDRMGINCTQVDLVKLNERHKTATVDFVGKDYFDIYQFRFIEGRAFTKEEAEAGDKKAVIKKELADIFFPNGSAVGGKVTIQDVEYEIIGVVDNYSKFAAPNVEGSIWVSYKYNKGIPTGRWWYKVSILFKPGMEEKDMKAQVADAVQHYFSNRNIEVDFDENDAISAAEVKQKDAGIGSLAIGGIILLLLLIPSLNILTLNMTNAYTRAAEIAVRRAIGSSKLKVFFQQMQEIFILVLIGLFLGILLALPVVDVIQNLLFGAASREDMALIAHLDYAVVFGQVLPLTILFAFLSGGIPIFLVTNKNIATILKGEGDKQ